MLIFSMGPLACGLIEPMKMNMFDASMDVHAAIRSACRQAKGEEIYKTTEKVSVISGLGKFTCLHCLTLTNAF